MANDTTNPAAKSAEATAMESAWSLIADIRAGATVIKKAGEKYLPRFSKEARSAYASRLQSAPWRPEFEDALASLAARPFAKPVALQGEPPAAIKTFVDDVDGQGNNLHVFARSVFLDGAAHGLGTFLVNYPITSNLVDGRPRTRADDLREGLRPYWARLCPADILALYVDYKGGREVVTHLRYRECVTVRDGFGESKIDRVRILEPGRWETWEKKAAGFEKVASGELTIDSKPAEVPLVVFFTGERRGAITVKPPLLDLATMQIELYNALSRYDEILTYSGSPLLVGVGMSAPEVKRDGNNELTQGQQIEVGPKTVLFAPPAPEGRSDWKFIAPDPAAIGEVRQNVEGIIADFRRLAMQPLTARSGNITATATSVEASKAHSALQAWTLALKDALDRGLQLTAQWLGEKDVATVSVHADFAADIGAGADMDSLLKARLAGERPRETYWAELRRRGKLGEQFDADEETRRLDEELPATSRAA